MKNYWTLALVLSLSIHALFFAVLIFWKNINVDNKNEKAVKEEFSLRQMNIDTIEENIKPKFGAFEDISVENPPPYKQDFLDKLIGSSQEISLNKPQIIEENIKDIMLSDIAFDSGNSFWEYESLKQTPQYMKYYRLVMSKIKQKARYYYDQQDRKPEGDVFLRFDIFKNGRLSKLSLNENSQHNSEILENIALQSVEAAQPFPSFTGELENHDKIPFSVAICFKNN